MSTSKSTDITLILIMLLRNLIVDYSLCKSQQVHYKWV